MEIKAGTFKEFVKKTNTFLAAFVRTEHDGTPWSQSVFDVTNKMPHVVLKSREDQTIIACCMPIIAQSSKVQFLRDGDENCNSLSTN